MNIGSPRRPVSYRMSLCGPSLHFVPHSKSIAFRPNRTSSGRQEQRARSRITRVLCGDTGSLTFDRRVLRGARSPTLEVDVTYFALGKSAFVAFLGSLSLVSVSAHAKSVDTRKMTCEEFVNSSHRVRPPVTSLILPFRQVPS